VLRRAKSDQLARIHRPVVTLPFVRRSLQPQLTFAFIGAADAFIQAFNNSRVTVGFPRSVLSQFVTEARLIESLRRQRILMSIPTLLLDQAPVGPGRRGAVLDSPN
jgi:hypothetical protein